MKINRILTLLLICLIPSFSGCAVYMAANQPGKRNFDVLNVGTYRSRVLAEFGQPVATETRDGKTVDIFKFVQGYSDGSKAGRALFHGAADVLTLGLWEVVGTPIESIADGDEIQIEVIYDLDQNVESVNTLNRK